MQSMVDKAAEVGSGHDSLPERVREVSSLFERKQSSQLGPEGEAFLAGLLVSSSEHGGGYLEAIRSITPDLAAPGVSWLSGVVRELTRQAETVLKVAGEERGKA